MSQLIGIGTDIVQISRIENSLSRHGTVFAQRILHPNELEVFVQHPQAAHYLAKRFATKEALAKALGTGIAQGVAFIDIETYHNQYGQPKLRLHGKTAAKAQALNMQHSYLSVSDEKEYAIAYVILS
jgi:holo-[acyl-carrier protein] synthase